VVVSVKTTGIRRLQAAVFGHRRLDVPGRAGAARCGRLGGGGAGATLGLLGVVVEWTTS